MSASLSDHIRMKQAQTSPQASSLSAVHHAATRSDSTPLFAVCRYWLGCSAATAPTPQPETSATSKNSPRRDGEAMMGAGGGGKAATAIPPKRRRLERLTQSSPSTSGLAGGAGGGEARESEMRNAPGEISTVHQHTGLSCRCPTLLAQHSAQSHDTPAPTKELYPASAASAARTSSTKFFTMQARSSHPPPVSSSC